MRNALIFFAYILAVPACFLGLLLVAMWLSIDSHEFGPWNPKYLFLIHGTTVGNLGLVDPIAGSLGYMGEGRDGTAPAYAYVTFTTKARPEDVIATYEARCRAIGLAVQRQSSNQQKLGLTCERDGAEVGVTASRLEDVTEVNINGWEFN
ncbi:hypothetical protein [Microvirga lotononidis]|uniref:Uncharacterized protein n=1 Tax=Microvirga lotononidis TaxID=864069 RepID=I4YKN5_9HYPH|nr:hypothetical protein [Microvirga lotononidis]EIM24527.1 hypothetical protein MicloDRAFT_00052400 [Microvirga lotononidis]WQO26548.1 hypothetical protein U0023_17935 [Microvirga lotononidis]